MSEQPGFKRINLTNRFATELSKPAASVHVESPDFIDYSRDFELTRQLAR